VRVEPRAAAPRGLPRKRRASGDRHPIHPWIAPGLTFRVTFERAARARAPGIGDPQGTHYCVKRSRCGRSVSLCCSRN